MASKPCCDAGAPVQHDYERKGTSTPVGDLKEEYLTGSGKKAIIFVHDIFGFDYKQVLSCPVRCSLL
jgi:hypothetical protein